MKTRFLFLTKITKKLRWIDCVQRKSIGEVRAFEELKVQERLNVADAFFGLLNYKK